MAERGERQRLVFGLIRDMGWITSRDLVESFGLSKSGAATELSRYQVQGFLHRERVPGGVGPPIYRYRLNKSGEDKARWWADQGFLTPSGQEHLPGLEPLEPELRRRVVRPVIHRRRVVRPEIHRRGD